MSEKYQLPSFLANPRTPYLSTILKQGLPPTSPSIPTEVDTPSPFRSGSLVGKLYGDASQLSLVPQASEASKKIVLYSREYYTACSIGGAMCCGLTHMAVTPIDVVKCNKQIDPSTTFSKIIKNEGILGLTRGWFPTLIGYSIQGACKYGFYEYFKKLYTDLAGPDAAVKYQTLIFLAGSASAEVIADVGLVPFEAVKVKVQTNRNFGTGLFDGMPKFIAAEGVSGLYKSLVPLWGRQIPYTMMKFAAFENTVQVLYQYVVPKPKSECSKPEQLLVSFAAGYIAGVLCAVVSHPADNLVSKLNQTKGISIGQVIQDMGWYQLFTRGLGLRIVMVGTLTGLQWGIYDSFKIFVGLPTTGGIQKDEPKK